MSISVKLVKYNLIGNNTRGGKLNVMIEWPIFGSDQHMSRRVAAHYALAIAIAYFSQRALHFNANKSTHCTPNTSNRLQMQSKCNSRHGSDAQWSAFSPKHWHHIDVGFNPTLKGFLFTLNFNGNLITVYSTFLFKTYYVPLINNLNVRL